METKIGYRKIQIFGPLAAGILLVLCGSLARFYGSPEITGFAGLGGLWIGIGLHKWRAGYLTLGQNAIKRNDAPFAKEIAPAEITEIKWFAGDWLVRYGNGKELIVSSEAMDKQGKAEFEGYVAKIRAAHV